ncbi:hypothetical protein [Patulibacter minatonensis]|uniref:hypothetical protein n=1 Tax=Patulibacter minatonensis TaxID=298163 RepID=UPI000478BB8E|nr:hypothetical protein [Patulibacter minatonensis]
MKNSGRSIAIGATVGTVAALALAGPAQGALFEGEATLDAHRTNQGSDPYTQTAEVNILSLLPIVLPVQIEVRGAVSLWAHQNWANPRFPVIGTPLPEPRYPSPGVVNGPVGVDAGGRFAQVTSNGVSAGTSNQNLEIDLGDGRGFRKLPLTAVVGKPNTYRLSFNTARVLTTRVRARLYDPAAQDNYGQFKITVKQL